MLIDNDASMAAYQIAQVFALRNDAKATFEWLGMAQCEGGLFP